MKLPLVVAALALALPAAALAAEAPACRLPPRIMPEALPVPDGPRRTGPMTGTTLALSWSPQFCRNHKGDAVGGTQCDGSLGRFGFVLHGLWPDGLPGQWPQWCPAAVPSAETLRRLLCMTPSARLLAHEWAKHGSCMAPTPEAYFAQGARRMAALHLPDMDSLSRRRVLTAGDLRRAFIARNPGLTPQSIRISATGSGWLQEVQLCADTADRPKTCDGGGLDDSSVLRIWRGGR